MAIYFEHNNGLYNLMDGDKVVLKTDNIDFLTKVWRLLTSDIEKKEYWISNNPDHTVTLYDPKQDGMITLTKSQMIEHMLKIINNYYKEGD